MSNSQFTKAFRSFKVALPAIVDGKRECAEKTIYIPSEPRIIIQKRGNTDLRSIQIKAKLREPILNYIVQEGQKGNWIKGLTGMVLWGVRDYCNPDYLKKVLAPEYTSEQDILAAQFLCFEAICSVVLQQENIHLDSLLKPWVVAYPAVYIEIIEKHPEYFVDGSLVKKLVKDQAKVNEILGTDPYIVEADIPEAQSMAAAQVAQLNLQTLEASDSCVVLSSQVVTPQTQHGPIGHQSSLNLSDFERKTVIKKLKVDPERLRQTFSMKRSGIVNIDEDEEEEKQGCQMTPYCCEIEIEESLGDLNKIAAKALALELPGLEWELQTKWEPSKQIGVKILILRFKINEQKLTISRVKDKLENISDAINSVVIRQKLIQVLCQTPNPQC